MLAKTRARGVGLSGPPRSPTMRTSGNLFSQKNPVPAKNSTSKKKPGGRGGYKESAFYLLLLSSLIIDVRSVSLFFFLLSSAKIPINESLSSFCILT